MAAQLPARRRADLLAFVRDRGQATVGELAEFLEVSLDTVRRDLENLAREGSLTRTHGGAVPTGTLARHENPLQVRMADQPEAKARIAARAAGFVADGQTVLLNGGTTTLGVVANLADRRDLTIVTNNLLIPPALPDGVARGVYVVGGSTRMRSMATVGRLRFPDAQGRTSLAVSADLAIVGVSTVSLDGVFGVSNLREAQLMREMVDAGRTVVLMADSSKLDRTGFAHVCTAKEIDVFVTDAPIPRPLTVAFARAGVRVVLAR